MPDFTVYTLETDKDTHSVLASYASFTALGVAAIPPLVELVELVESLNLTPPKVEALPVGNGYLVSVIGGV